MRAVEVNGYTIEAGANLAGVYLDGSTLSRADLNGAVADDDTQWPDDFAPLAAGVSFE